MIIVSKGTDQITMKVEAREVDYKSQTAIISLGVALKLLVES